MRIHLEQAVGPILCGSSDSPIFSVDMQAASPAETLNFISAIAELQRSTPHVKAGEHRLDDWASGWAENLTAFRENGDVNSLTPRYFGKYPEVRLNGKLYIDSSGKAELKLLRALQTAALTYTKQVIDFKGVCEFGAGTGHNLVNFGSDKSIEFLHGFEWSWSGVACIRELGRRLDGRINGQFFDYYAPDIARSVDLSACCAITVASLEQIGGNFRPYLQFLRSSRPKVVINIEPIQELMGAGPLSDLSRDYARKRNYLLGYYAYLKNLQRAGVVEILVEQDSLIGSKFLNGYGTVIWRWAD
jgi:hypothetical protein